MANATVASWTACIKELQGFTDDPHTAPNFSFVQKRVAKLVGDPESLLPNAA
jgi:hypothetical protein